MYPGINLEILKKLKCDVMSSFVVAVCAEYTRNTVQSKIPYAPTLTLGVIDGYSEVQFDCLTIC